MVKYDMIHQVEWQQMHENTWQLHQNIVMICYQKIKNVYFLNLNKIINFIIWPSKHLYLIIASFYNSSSHYYSFPLQHILIIMIHASYKAFPPTHTVEIDL